MAYTMAQFRKRIGVSRETLRYYEQRGLLKPERKDGSNYRVYSDADGMELMRLRLMQSFHLSLEEISGACPSLREQDEHLSSIEERLERQLAHVQTELKRIRKNRSFVRDAMATDGGVCELETHGIYKLMLFGKDVEEDERCERIAAQWLQHMPVTDIGWEISLQALKDAGDDPVATKLGMMVLPFYVDEYELSIEPPVYFFPAGPSIRIMVRTSDPLHVHRAQLEPLFRYAQEKGYRIVSDISGRYSGCEWENDAPVYYFSARALVDKRR